MTIDGSSSEAGSRRRRPPRVQVLSRAPIVVVVAAALLVAIVAQRNAPSAPSPSTLAAAAVRAGQGVPAGDVASSAWYCAAGTSSSGGTADETVMVASLALDAIDAVITVMPGGETPSKSRRLRLAPGEEVRVAIADVLATAEPGVLVEAVGGPVAVSHVLEHRADVAVEPCTRTASTNWYFASGTTVDGSHLDLVVFNPFGDDAIVDVSFVTDAGAQEPSALQALVVPRRSRITIPVQDSVLRQARVATHVHARSGRVVAEQMQIFDNVAVGSGPNRDGIALALGATAPATVSRIAAGSTSGGGNAILSLANFSETDARVDVRVVLVGGQELPPDSVRVPARGVIDTGVTTRVPSDSDYAVVVSARAVDGRRVPVVAELLAVWPPQSSTTGLAGVLATTDVATRWVVPQPDVDGERFLTVFNPGPDPVTAELLPADLIDRPRGATSAPELAVPAGAARTLRLSLLGTRPVAAVLTANHPVVVGLTVLGKAGASVSAGIPDLNRAS